VSVFRRILGTNPEERNLNGLGLVPTAFDRVPGLSSTRVDAKSTLGLTSAWACVRILADLISTMPLDAYRRDNGERRPYRPGGTKPTWLITPLPGEPAVGIQSVISEIIVSLYLSGDAFVYTPRDPETLEPLEVRPLDPRSVTINRRGRDVTYTVRNSEHTTGVEFGPDTILHIPLIRLPGQDRGINPIEALRNTLALGMTLEDSASNFFATGSTPTGILESADSLTADQIKSIKEGWLRHHTGANQYTPGVLTGGLTFKPLAFKPEDAQLLSSREFTVNEIARIFRVPPALLAVTTPGAMSYASVEQLSEDFVRFTLRPLAEIIERPLSTLIPLPEAFVKFSMDALLRGSTESRFNAYRTGLASGFLTVSQIRRWEDMPPVPDDSGDVFRQPLNEADAALVTTKQKTDIYTALIGSGMDEATARRIAGL
jgi:HK97 family phage portal protein